MTSPSRALFAAGLALAALSGCDRGKDERTQAAGEILEGTVSDAMIKTDQIRSEAPLAPRKAGTAGTARAADRDADANDAAPTSETPAPAASETPEQPSAPAPASPTPPAA